jgi:hypothetical protein
MTLIRPVAMAAPDRVYLAPHIEQLSDEDRGKRFVSLLILYARDAQAGRLHCEPRRYLPGRAERSVREQLVPSLRFRVLEHLDDDSSRTHPTPRPNRSRREELAGGRRGVEGARRLRASPRAAAAFACAQSATLVSPGAERRVVAVRCGRRGTATSVSVAAVDALPAPRTFRR